MNASPDAMNYAIALAEEHHLQALAAIELAAARLLAGHAPEAVLRETTERPVFMEALRNGRLWVALTGGTPVGFALVTMPAAGAPHLEEIDVDPPHGRRGLGTRLVAAVCAWAADTGHAQVTLTTFRGVRWNMPFYARLGFVELAPDAWSPELAAIVAGETARGLSPDTRVVMACRCRPVQAPSSR